MSCILFSLDQKLRPVSILFCSKRRALLESCVCSVETSVAVNVSLVCCFQFTKIICDTRFSKPNFHCLPVQLHCLPEYILIINIQISGVCVSLSSCAIYQHSWECGMPAVYFMQEVFKESSLS